MPSLSLIKNLILILMKQRIQIINYISIVEKYIKSNPLDKNKQYNIFVSNKIIYNSVKRKYNIIKLTTRKIYLNKIFLINRF